MQSALEHIRQRALPDKAKTFLARLLRAEGRSIHTVLAYTLDLERYFAFLKGKNAAYPDVKRVDLEEFTESLSEKAGLNERSINRTLSAVKSFYRWLNDTEEFVNSVRDWIAPPKFQRKMAVPLSQEEVRSLLKVIQGNPFRKKPEVWLQDYIMIRLLYATGMRIGDLVQLQTQDVDLPQKSALIRRAKGKKTRWVVYDEGTRILLTEFLRKFPRPSDSPLFRNARKAELSQSALRMYIRRELKRYARKADLSKNVYPHLLRHTCGVHLLENGADLKTIQDLFGHSSISTTQIYLEMSPQFRRKQYESSHPLAK